MNYKQTVKTANTYQKIISFRVAHGENISYFVHNLCCHNSAIVKMMISPDGKIWMADGLEIEVPPGELIILVPNYFAKFSTLEYKSKCLCHPAKLDIWFQMTMPPFYECGSLENDFS